MPDTELDSIMKDIFSDVSIDKRLSRRVGSNRVIPDYVSDWLVSRYSDDNVIDDSKVASFLEKHLPDKKQKQRLLYDLSEGRELKILDAYAVRVDVESDRLLLEIPSLDINNAGIVDGIVDEHPLLLLGNVWGAGTLQRRLQKGSADRYEVFLADFKPMQTSIVDLDYFIEARRHFTLSQWRSMLIRTMGYNPGAYTIEQQMHMLTRLCPMVQPRVNLIELAPKGTGKSYVFSSFSRHSWLVSGGTVTRAQLFYNMRSRSAGVITRFDSVVLDEIQTIKFSNEGEIVGALKGYLEQGEFRIMKYKGTADAGLVLLANIPIRADSRPRDHDLFATLPTWLQGQSATALLDRFHGLLPGWELPRINKDCLCDGISLRADYFAEILHSLRQQAEYDYWVKEHTQSSGDLRDIKAVERLSSGFLRLLFPDLSMATPALFDEHCLHFARQLRQRIRNQLSLLDEEYSPEVADIEARM